MLVFIWAIMLGICIISLIAIYFFCNSKFLYNAPPVPSCGKVRTAMIEDVSLILTKRKNQIVMDLGSGWGSLLLPLAKKFPRHRFIGIEHGFIPYYFSKFISRKLKNINFYRQNFFNSNISKADVVFVFLLPHIMPKISVKCQKEAKENALIYVNRFPISDIKPKKEVSLGSKYDTYYVYKIQKNQIGNRRKYDKFGKV